MQLLSYKSGHSISIVDFYESQVLGLSADMVPLNYNFIFTHVSTCGTYHKKTTMYPHCVVV